MPFGLGFFATAGATAGGSYELIETITVGSGGASSVTFSNLNTYSSTYQHLQIRAVAKNTAAVGYNVLEMAMRLNGATSSYRSHRLIGDGSSVASGDFSSLSSMLVGQTISSDSGISPSFAGSIIDILDPFETTKNTTIRSLSGGQDSRSTLGPTGVITLYSGAYFSTTAVSSITLYGATGLGSNLTSFAQGSRFSIYGLKAS